MTPSDTLIAVPSGFIGDSALSNAEFHTRKFRNSFLEFSPRNPGPSRSKFLLTARFTAQILPGNLISDASSWRAEAGGSLFLLPPS